MSFTIWFTGIPASGKTTLAKHVHKYLKHKKKEVQLLDSDSFVQLLQGYFEAGPQGRELNNRVMAIVCRFLNRHHIICITSSTSPRLEYRNSNRRLIGNYIEVHCKCTVEIAEKRDPKGLYKLARQGLIADFTGIGEVYETTLSSEITVDTGSRTIEQCLTEIIEYLNLYMENLSGERMRHRRRITK